MSHPVFYSPAQQHTAAGAPGITYLPFAGMMQNGKTGWFY
jgi:hypothetical protein